MLVMMWTASNGLPAVINGRPRALARGLPRNLLPRVIGLLPRVIGFENRCLGPTEETMPAFRGPVASETGH